MNTKEKTTYMEVDLGQLKDNFRKVRSFVGKDIGIISVVKCDGYGLGLVPVSQTLYKAGSEKIGVSTSSEAVKIKKENKNIPVVTLSPPLKWEIPTLIQANAEITVDDIKDIEAIRKISHNNKIYPPRKIHVMVDTGMNRYGIPPQEAVDFIKSATKIPQIKIEGIFSHFSTATRSDKFAVSQFAIFMEVIKRLAENGIEIPTIHIANSAAVMSFPDTINPRIFRNIMPSARLFIRPGGILYGLYGDLNKKTELKMNPVLRRVVSHIAHIAEIEAGEIVGYGRRWVSQEETQIATVPVGFGDDGYLIRTTEPAPLDKEPTQVLIHGKRCKIVGLVASSGFGVDLEGIHAKKGDEVVLIGKDGNEEITLDEITDRNSLISMQLLTLLGARMERVYVH